MQCLELLFFSCQWYPEALRHSSMRAIPTANGSVHYIQAASLLWSAISLRMHGHSGENCGRWVPHSNSATGTFLENCLDPGRPRSKNPFCMPALHESRFAVKGAIASSFPVHSCRVPV